MTPPMTATAAPPSLDAKAERLRGVYPELMRAKQAKQLAGEFGLPPSVQRQMIEGEGAPVRACRFKNGARGFYQRETIIEFILGKLA